MTHARTFTCVAGAIAAAFFASAVEVRAQATNTCTPDPPTQKADADTIKAVGAAYTQGGFAALRPHLPELQQALDRAPAALPAVERCGEEEVVHTPALAAFMFLSVAKGARHPGDAPPKRIIWRPTPYPMAALMIGSYDNETGQWAAAAAVLMRGLALDPTNPDLASEGALSLARLNRHADGLAICDRVLAENKAMTPIQEARLQRTRGFALEELRRFDEAEAAYNRSLVLEPQNRIALNELNYIKRQRAGAPMTAVQMTLSHPPAPAAAPPPIQAATPLAPPQ